MTYIYNLKHCSLICTCNPEKLHTAFCFIGCVEYFGSVMKAGAVKCVAVADEVAPGFCDYSFDCTHFKLFKKDGSVMVDGK